MIYINSICSAQLVLRCTTLYSSQHGESLLSVHCRTSSRCLHRLLFTAFSTLSYLISLLAQAAVHSNSKTLRKLLGKVKWSEYRYFEILGSFEPNT
eukprot:892-Heterococcus_DN1.PRE.1